MTERDRSIIIHIEDHCTVIEQLVSRFGADFDVFISDEAYYRSVTLSVFQIGELAGKLSEQFREKTSNQIPWHQVRKMRNVIAHDYQAVDDETLWDTVLNDIPVLLNFCKSMIVKEKHQDVR